MAKLNKKIIITGGGSGGHVSAATGIIDELRKQYKNAAEQILYIGGKPVSESYENTKSIEQRRIENTEIKFQAIRAGKLQRSFTFKSIKLLFGVLGGLIDSWKIINKYQPDIIFSTGGYVTVPVCIIAGIKKIPVYIHEQTAAIGLANRISSWFAKKIYLTFPQSAKHFKNKNTLHTGNIVRKCTWQAKNQTKLTRAVKEMTEIRQKTEKPIIYISGGGQGSHLINKTVRGMLNYILLKHQIILQTGENVKHKDYEVLIKDRLKLSKDLQDSLYITKYVEKEEIGYLFKHMDIYLGRSGANTVYEMGLLKKPSILIPIPWVTNNEQEKNAQILVNCGLGKIIPQGEVNAKKLYNEIKLFVRKWRKGNYKGNKELLEKAFRKGAAEKIVKDLPIR